ncbi:MAG TPA: heavy metal-associated domain-containing protein [Bacteroides sp.]|nr:heavy metal-associated domain-containing protein [Bacteroides sp.]
MTHILQYLSAFADLTMEMAPYLLLGFLFAGILYVWFPKKKVYKYLGKPNTASVINAALIGIPLPLCSCGVIPTGISFYNSGASKGSSVSFLISTPQTGADSLMVTYSMLGLPMAIIKPIIALFTGVLGGFMTNKLDRNENRRKEPIMADKSLIAGPAMNLNKPVIAGNLVLADGSNSAKAGNGVPNDNGNGNSAETENGALDRSLRGMLRYAFVEFLEDIAKWLVIGLALAALIEILVPESFFTSYLGNEYLGMLLVLAAAVPLYVCATGSVPIAAILMLKGLSPGAAIVFLMAGPATNAATMTVIGNVFGRRTLVLYLISIIAGAYFFGVIVNEFLPREWFLNPLADFHAGPHEHGFLPMWLNLGSGVLLGGLILYALYNKYISGYFKSRDTTQTNQTETDMNNIEVTVKGMTCNHCKATVENNVAAMDGIDSAQVDLSTEKVSIRGENVDLEKVKEKIESLGYKFFGKD